MKHVFWGYRESFNACFMFAVRFLLCKVSKVAYFTKVEGSDQCLKFICVYVLSVAKVAEVAVFMCV